MKTIKILGVCAAQGALLFPFKNSQKFSIVGNIEPRGVFHTKKEEQWSLNFPGIPFARDPEHFQKTPIDIIVGSPSCGHSSVFSYSRKKTLGKPREDKTLNLFLNQIEQHMPIVWAMENLPKLLDLIPLEEWRERFDNYEFIVHCYSVSRFGNSQVSRKRLLMIGVRKDHSEIVPYLSKVYEIRPLQSCRELRKAVRRPLNYRETRNKVLAMYDYRDKTKTNLTVQQVHYLWRHDFKEEYKWPMKGTKMKTLPGVYRNKLDSYPLTARPSSRQFDPFGRIMGLEDYRVIMGFPREFKVYMPRCKKGSREWNYWVNKGRNTLTKGSTYEMAFWFYKCLRKAIRKTSRND